MVQLRKENFDPKKEKSEKYIGLEHIGKRTLSLIGIGVSSDTISGKYRFYPDDILFGKLRPYFRKVIYARFEGVCSTDILVVKPEIDVDSKFLYYLMASDEFIEYSMKGSTGTKMPRANWEFLSDLYLYLPPIITQNKIGLILDQITQKIELNNHMNEILEQMAQAIFKSWFVDFEPFKDPKHDWYVGENGFEYNEELEKEIPIGWQVENIEGLAKVQNGKKPKSKSDTKNGEFIYPIYSGAGIIGFSKEYRYKEKVIVTGRVGTLGLIHHTTGNLWTSDNTIVIIPNHEDFYYLQYCFFKTINLARFNRGSSHPLIVQDDIKKLKIALPSDKTKISKFANLISELFKKINTNHAQIKTLEQLRECLLPQLISGKLRIPNPEKFLEELENVS